MSKQAQIPLEAGVMQITLGTFTGDFFVAAIPGQMKAIAITGIVCDEKNHDANMEDARRIAACWNACDGIDTEQLEILGDNVTTLKERYEALQKENADLQKENCDQKRKIIELEKELVEWNEFKKIRDAQMKALRKQMP